MNILSIIKWLLKMLKPKPVLSLPHPEEPENPAATLANVNVAGEIAKWLVYWEVPYAYREYWKTAIDIQVYDVYPDFIINMGVTQKTPALTWDADGKRHLAVKPKWLNPGVIAHEQAHNSYALLTEDQKEDFSLDYYASDDPLLAFLEKQNWYMHTSVIEAHAEIYRYLGQFMPDGLKIYFPKLF